MTCQNPGELNVPQDIIKIINCRVAELREIPKEELWTLRTMSRLTGEQLSIIRDKYKEFWASLPEEQQNAFQAIIDAGEKGKDIIDAWQESITGISYNSFYNEFVDTLSDMDMSAADMAENFGEYLRKSILAAMVAKNFQKDIDGLYDKWVAAGDEKSDGGLDITDDEAKDIQDEYKKLADAMVKKREEMEKLYGWESEADKKEGVTGQLKAAMTEGTASQLVGLWNMTALDIRAIKDLTAEHFRQAKPYMLNVESILAETRQINANTKRGADNTDGLIEELREGFFSMNGRLKSIEDNTKTSKSRG